MKANGRLAYLHSSSIKQKSSIDFSDHDQGCTPILARTFQTCRLATRKLAMSSTDFCDDFAVAVIVMWQMLGASGEHYANCLGSSSVLGQDVAPLRNAPDTCPDGPLPVSGMSSKTDTNPMVASAARPKKATALPYWSVV